MRFSVAQGLPAGGGACTPASFCSPTTAAVLPRAPLAARGAAATCGPRPVCQAQQQLSRRVRAAATTNSQAPSENASSRKSAGSGSSSGSNGSGSSATDGGRRSESSSGVPTRMPRIPPLPYWCDGVAVVGLPDDQLVFCFQTPTQASATARRQLRPEARYGAGAVKLAALSADKAQTILDRWQYAAAQQELGSLGARPRMHWWRYESAVKSLQLRPASPGSGAAASNGTAADAPASNGTAALAAAAAAAAAAADAAPTSGSASPRDAEALTRRQRRQAAKLARAAANAAAKAERREQRLLRRKLRRAERAAAEAYEQQQQQQQQQDKAEGADEGQQSWQPGTDGSRQRSPPSALQPSWELVTLRGLPDGTVIFKFGGYEPLPAPSAVGGSSSGDSSGESNGDCSSGDSSGDGSSGDTSDKGSSGSRNEEVWQGLLRQQLLHCQEGVAWSNALRLGSAYPDQAVALLEKLQAFTVEWEQHQGSAVRLNAGLHPSFASALTKARKRAARLGWLPTGQPDAAAGAAAAAAAAAEQEAQEEGLGRRAAAKAGRQQQQQQRERRQQEQQQAAGAQRGGSSSNSTDIDSTTSAAAGAAAQAASAAASAAAASQAEAAAAAAARSTADESTRTAVGQAARVSEQEAEWQVELQPRPQRLEPPPKQQEGGNGSRPQPKSRQLMQQVEAQPEQQQQQQEKQQQYAEGQQLWHGVLALLAAMAAVAAGFVALLRRLAGRAAAAAGCWVLALYRRLPVAFRRLFWRISWPPKWSESHVSPTLAALLDGAADVEQLAAAGFDNQGRTSAPLADLPAWRVEQLTLAGVRDLGLYRAAFTHKSALPPEERTEKSFERLEFLGDSVLGLTCRTMLMQRRPSSDEGEMTKLQGVLVSGAAAARYAAWLGLDKYVLMELKGLREAAQHTPAILGDVFEALLGAIYLDQGFKAAQRFCIRVLDTAVDWEQLAVAEEWKGMLSRFAAVNGKPQPRYAVRATSQREYKEGLALKWWKVDVHFQGSVIGTGGSFDKRQAEQLAAKMALRKLGELP
ncbi:hypothetical protein ABPG75_013588 [Micractinium tetrahymenae]